MGKMAILLLVPVLYTMMIAEASVRDEDMEELNKIILKEIQLKREAMEILKADTAGKSDISRYHKTESDSSRSNLPLSLSKWMKDVANKNNGADAAGEKDLLVEKEVEEITMKRDIRNAILKKDITDALVDILYDRLKSKRGSDISSILKDTYKKDGEGDISSHSIQDVHPTNYATLGGTRKAVIEESEKTGSNPPGIWGRGIRGPPGLWGKKDEEMSNYDSLMTTAGSGPPGLWGRQLLNKRSSFPPERWGRWGGREAHDRKLSDLTGFLESHEQDIWHKRFEKKTNKGSKSNIMT